VDPETFVSLDLDVRHHFDEFRLEVRATVGRGLTALVGPSGSGKTTLLNILAGLLRPNAGTVRLDGDVLTDTSARRFVRPDRRAIGIVFQEPRLFPHLTVKHNLLYGRWFRRAGGSGPSPDGVIDLLKLGALLSRRPAHLSGGEKQRVALGRALLSRPKWLLLDEPLASVDRAHREEILPYLDRIRAEYALPAIYVTHTWPEVSDRADHVLDLRNGRLEFSGPATGRQG